MHQRINAMVAAPETYQAVIALEKHIQNSGLPRRLIHLLKLRASAINGCAFCVDMHTKEARRDGLSEQWISLIPVWHEAMVYSDAERALLAWTDAITRIADSRAPDADFEAMRAHYSDADIVKLTAAIGVINVWNRLAVGMRTPHPVEAGARAA
jgi:AhpD family alkylhydroperoxidase